VFVNDAVLLEDIGGNAIELARSLRFGFMPQRRFKTFASLFELVGIVGAIQPREVDIYLVGVGVGPFRRRKRIGNQRDARVRRAAGRPGRSASL
jgi:hypothetical protein